MAHEFEEGFNRGDVDRTMQFYGDTYVDVNLRQPVQTHGARRDYDAHVMRRPGLRVQVQPDDILIRGDLAFVRGPILLTQAPVAGAEPTRTELRYLEVAERTSQGGWRVSWGMDGPIQEDNPGPQ